MSTLTRRKEVKPMNPLVVTALRVASRVIAAQLWHLKMLGNPLYNASMPLLAGLLLGRIQLHHLRQWLTDLLSTLSNPNAH